MGQFFCLHMFTVCFSFQNMVLYFDLTATDIDFAATPAKSTAMDKIHLLAIAPQYRQKRFEICESNYSQTHTYLIGKYIIHTAFLYVKKNDGGLYELYRRMTKPHSSSKCAQIFYILLIRSDTSYSSI